MKLLHTNAHDLQAGDTFALSMFTKQTYKAIKVERKGETFFVTVDDARHTVIALNKMTSVFIHAGK